MKDRGLILILFSCYFYHRMDDPVIFLNYLTNTCNVTVPRAQNKILGFLPDFRALLNTPESQIDEFVKNTHSSNSARAANARILVPSGAIILLKSLRFELEDRRKCNALPNGAQLAAVNNQDMAIFRQQRSQAIEQESQRRQSSLPDLTVPKFDGSDPYYSENKTLVNLWEAVTHLDAIKRTPALISNLSGTPRTLG